MGSSSQREQTVTFTMESYCFDRLFFITCRIPCNSRPPLDTTDEHYSGPDREKKKLKLSTQAASGQSVPHGMAPLSAGLFFPSALIAQPVPDPNPRQQYYFCKSLSVRL